MKSSRSTPSRQFYEGCGREGPIKCIFLSEFHPVAGPKITCQVPEGYVTKEIFDAVNVYIIPKSPLQRCILTVNTLGHKIVGYPVRIDHQRYARNAYYFNLCFVCDSWARTVQYEPVVKKLAEYLITMEDETAFLSQDMSPDLQPTDTAASPLAVARSSRLQPLLATIQRELNARKVCTTVVGETTIYLRLVAPQPDPPAVADHQVPLLRPEYQRQPADCWDLTTQQILPYIDGSAHIGRIAAASQVERALVKACVQNLVYYGVVRLLPLLKYSNVYMCTRSLQRLTKEPALGRECRRFVALDNWGGADEPPFAEATVGSGGCRPLRWPSLQKILLMYACMTHGVNLRTLCERCSPREAGICERKLVTFGLLHKLIRCINKYPVCVDPAMGGNCCGGGMSGGGGASSAGRQRLYTGQQSVDEICCRAGLQPAKVEEDIESDPLLVVFWK